MISFPSIGFQCAKHLFENSHSKLPKQPALLNNRILALEDIVSRSSHDWSLIYFQGI